MKVLSGMLLVSGTAGWGGADRSLFLVVSRGPNTTEQRRWWVMSTLRGDSPVVLVNELQCRIVEDAG